MGTLSTVHTGDYSRRFRRLWSPKTATRRTVHTSNGEKRDYSDYGCRTCICWFDSWSL